MPDPVLHVIAGPNGAGTTTFYDEVLEPATHLQFVNADVIAAQRWPGEEVEHAYEASALAATAREQLKLARRSFATETVFSHPSKVALLADFATAGYLITLHVVLIPENLAVARVVSRVAQGGHQVPEEKVRARFHRLWRYVGDAVKLSDRAHVYDNTRAAEPFRLVASYFGGHPTARTHWPEWTPSELRQAGNA